MSGLTAAAFRAVYLAAQAWRGEPVAEVMRELRASERWPRERLLALQWERQRALLRHVWDTVPYWRERLRAAGAEPGDVRDRADWARLPSITKREMQEHAARLVSSRAPAGLKAATSGSSGTAVAVMRGHRSWAHAHANQFRVMAWNGIAVGERHAYLWGVPLDAAGRRKAALKDALFRRERCSAFTLDAERARAFHARLRRRPATWALGYPSAVTRFADACADAGLDGRALGWKAVVTTAEVLKPEQRQRIEAVFGCPVADLYGCAEAGVAGLGCERGGLHAPVESVVVNLEPAEDGASEVLLTDLHNMAEPVLRYRVGDLMADVPAADAVCACGRPLPLLGRVYGRAGDTLEFPDGRRVNANLPSYIFKKHGTSGTVREYQFVQFPDGVVELRILAGPAWGDAVRAELAAEVRRVLGLEVAIRTVPRFERRGRGKHRDYVRAEDIGEAAARPEAT